MKKKRQLSPSIIVMIDEDEDDDESVLVLGEHLPEHWVLGGESEEAALDQTLHVLVVRVLYMYMERRSRLLAL